MKKHEELLFAIAIFLFYSIFIVFTSHAGFPSSMKGDFFPYLSDKPVGEDGFYMLTVAWNIAIGKGISYNFDIATTGIQPLSTFIFALIAKTVLFFGGNKWTFVRFIILFGALAHTVLAFIVGKISKELSRIALLDGDKVSKCFYIGFILCLFSMGLYKLSVYGLETPIYLIFLGSLFLSSLVLIKVEQLSRSKIFILGILCGFCILSRIDSLVIFSIFSFLLLIFRKVNIKQLLSIFLISLPIFIPWFIYVYIQSGAPIPSSGGAQSSLINFDNFLERFQVFLPVILGNIVPIFVPNKVFFNAGNFIILMFLAFSILADKNKKSIFRITDNFVVRAWMISLLCLSTIYLCFFWATHFYHRYTSPLITLSLPLIAVVLSQVSYINKRALLCFIATLFFVQALGSFHLGKIGNNHSISAGFVAENYPNKNFIVGAYQSGVIGYFNENVINLDGKLDGNALQLLRRGQITDYIAEKDINFIIDWKEPVKNLYKKLNNLEGSSWEFCAKEIPNNASLCIQKKGDSV